MRTPRRPRAMLLAVTGSLALALGAQAAAPPPPPVPPSRPPEPLAGKLPPAPPAADYGRLVADKRWLVALGKALFWDEGVGSGGDQACASCHFHAGADPRTTNQLSPGLNVRPQADGTFGDPVNHLTGGGNQAGPNYALKPADFPFHRLQDPADRESAVLYDTDDVASSAGVFEGGFLFPTATVRFRGRRVDQCSQALSDIFHASAGGRDVNTRKAEPRNTPTVVNAAFNHRNFWDGRANNVFNGVDPFGRRSILGDPTARIVLMRGATPVLQALELPDMSAASQAVGPPRSDFEMACAGRSFADIGRRLLRKTALASPGQRVAPDDSVLGAGGPVGSLLRPTGVGLAYTYGELVRKAFQKDLFRGGGFWRVSPDGTLARAADAASGYTQLELNFSLFFGLAIDAYERTLVSDQSPFDRGTLSADEQAGLAVFQDPLKANCVACHDGPLFSKAATFQGDPAVDGEVERMVMGDGGVATYDNGFYDIGVRPAHEDLGVGGADRFGNPLSFARQYLAELDGKATPDRLEVDPCTFLAPFDPVCGKVPGSSAGQRVAVDGAFKVPSLRNVALTPPYFHDGGQKSLADVVAFYNRGGDRRDVAGGDTTGTGPLGRPDQAAPVGPGMGGSNLDADVGNPAGPNGGLGLSEQEQAQLVAFLKALTDPRVACHRAPFDHPSLIVPVGHRPLDVDPADGNADDDRRQLPAAGAGGYAGCDPGKLNGGDLFANGAMGLLSRNLRP